MKKLAFALLVVFLSVALFTLPVQAADNTVTLYFHKDASVGTVNTKASDGQVLNTSTSWSGSTQENASDTASGDYFSCFFYLYPTLAGTLTLNGVPSAVIYFKANASVNDLTYVTTINKIASGGSATLVSTKSSGSQSVGTSYAALTNTHSSVSTTVASGYTLQLNITIGGSASNLTLTIGYDTAATQSKLSLVATNPLSITLSSDKSIYEWEEGATLTATVTSVFGGYDIASAPTISFTTPTGLSYTSSVDSYAEAQYSNTYTYSLSPLNGEGGAGTWQATSAVSDKTGNSYTSSTLSFDLRQGGGQNVAPDQTSGDSPSSFFADNPLIIIAVVVALLCIWFGLSKGGKKSRRRRR